MDGVKVVGETDLSYITGDFHSEVSNHPFLRYVIEVTPLYIMQHNDMKKVLLGSENSGNETIDEALRNSKVLEGEDCKFLGRESALTYQLMLRIDKIQHTFFMLTYFPLSPDKNQLPLSRAEYIEDLLELYIINSISLQDRILELVAFMYGAKVVRSESKKKDQLYLDLANYPELVSVLKQLDHIQKPIRESRNTIIHASSYYDEDLENIFQYEMRYRIAVAKREKRAKGMLKELNQMYANYERSTLVDLHANDAILTKLLLDLFDCLYVQHKIRIRELSIKTRIKIKTGVTRTSRLRENAALINAVDWTDIAKVLGVSNEN